MNFLKLYGRVLRLLGSEARLGWLLAAANAPSAATVERTAHSLKGAAATLGRHVQWIGQKPVKTASGKTREAFAIVG